MLLKILFGLNEGNFTFRNTAKEAKTADYEFGWGTLLQDFNNDGLVDLAIAQNYIGFPPHRMLKLPSRLLMQLDNHSFAPVEKEAGAANPFFAISPLSADFSNNGYPDLVYTNLSGKLRVLLNKGGENNFLKVELKNEPRSIGATVTVTLANGKKLTGFFVPTQGLCTYQTNTLFFGLNKESEISSVMVSFTNGKTKEFISPKANSFIKVDAP